MRRLRTVLFVGLGLLALGVFGLMCQRVAARGRYAVAYSSYGAGPTGAQALYLLAGEIGARPVRWSQDLGHLPRRAMLVALGGCDNLMARPVSRFEREALAQWVDRGGVLVVAGAQDYLWKDIGVRLERPIESCLSDTGLVGMLVRSEREAEREQDEPPQRDPGQTGDPDGLDGLPQALRDDPSGTLDELTEEEPLPAPVWATPGALFSGMGAVPLRQPATVEVTQGVDAVSLLALPGGPAAVMVRRGEGAVVAIASASPFQNREVGNSDGGVIFARLVRELAPRGPVIFDEYHLGVGERRSFSQYVGELGGGALALQLLVVVLFVLWRWATRFGAPLVAPPAPPEGTASYVAAFGTLYAKSKDAKGAIGLLARHALQRVAEHHHVQSASSDALAEILEQSSRSAQAAAVRQLGAIALDPTIHKKDLVARARTIDALTAQAVRDQEPGDPR